MTLVIVNADDFGLSDGVCRAILELLEANAIGSTTLMMAVDGVTERLVRWDASQLAGRAGVHLQLTRGRPLSPPREIPTLVDASGCFRDPRIGAVPDPAHVALEWRRQFAAAAEALGSSPTHVDSHHGVHRISGCDEVYLDLARELELPVRGAAGPLGEHMRRRGVCGTIAIVREWTGRDLGPAELRRQVANAAAAHPDEPVEVIAHPGYSDERLRSISSLADAREGDRTSLLTLAREGWPADAGHRLGSFAELRSSRSRADGR